MDLSARFLALTLTGAGWVLWLLVALSVVSVAVMLERLWYMKRHRPDKNTLAADMRVLLADGAARDAYADEAEGAGAPRGEQEQEIDPERLAAVVDGAKAQMKLRLERRLAFLATLGSNAPFIGLFGTVLGIIKAFHDLAQSAGGGGSSVVMAGISEALVATAVGLLVAIPAVVAFNYFSRRVKAAMAQVEWMAHLAVADLRAAGALAAAGGRAV